MTQSAAAVEYTDYISAEGYSFPTNECPVTQSAAAVEYTDYISAEGYSLPPNECPVTQSAGAVKYTDYISADGYISLQTSVPWPNRLQQWNTPTTSLQRGIFSSKCVYRDPIGCNSGIHRLHLCRGVSLPPNECPVTQSAGAVEYTDYISAEG